MGLVICVCYAQAKGCWQVEPSWEVAETFFWVTDLDEAEMLASQETCRVTFACQLSGDSAGQHHDFCRLLEHRDLAVLW